MRGREKGVWCGDESRKLQEREQNTSVLKIECMGEKGKRIMWSSFIWRREDYRQCVLEWLYQRLCRGISDHMKRCISSDDTSRHYIDFF